MADSAFEIITQIINIVQIGLVLYPPKYQIYPYCRYFHSYIDAYDVIYIAGIEI